jgi:hypothetical protein
VSVLDTMRAATPLVRQVTLCLDGTLQGEYDALQKELVQVSLGIQREDSLAPTGQAAADRISADLNRIHDKMAASEVVFNFRALSWMRALMLRAEHPPRDGELVDRSLGYNVETYTPALVREACASVVGADGKVVTDIPDDVWDSMLTALNIEQVEVLRRAALQANESATTVPPSARSLLGSQDSEASSKSPGPGTSPQNGSKGGSRPRSQKSSTTKKAASSA